MAEYLLALNAGMLFQRGGEVSAGFAGPVPGSGTKDTFPAWLAPGEFVLGRSAAQALGLDVLDRLNMLHGGGIVHPARHYYQEAIEEHLSGPRWATLGYDPQMGQYFSGAFGALASGSLARLTQIGGLGYLPPTMTPGWGQGPTMIPTTFTSAGYPRAVPVSWAPTGGDYGVISGSRHMGVRRPKHEGGLISRYHDGGPVGSPGGSKGAPGINIYAFTDLKALVRHMAGKEGQKIIFDTVKGRRIDLGI
jgi:hypothetical protein